MIRRHTRSAPARWAVFARERFSPGEHLPMVASFFAGNALLAARLAETDIAAGPVLLGFLATLLVFFRLRVFDDIKDARRDREEHSDRPLARGLVSPAEARRVAVIVAVAELALVVAIGPHAIAAWAIVLVWSALMYREFFAGPWLRPRLELYAVTHTLVAGWLGLFVASVITSRPPWELPDGCRALVAANWAVFNLFEFARKTWARDEERPRVASYSGRLGPGGAVALATTQLLPAAGIVAWLTTATTERSTAVVALSMLAALGLLAALAYVLDPSRAAARRYRGAMGLFIFGIYAFAAILST